MTIMTETRYQRIGREQRERAAAREAAVKRARPRGRRHDPANKHRWEETYEDRLDDLGESPDY